MYRMITFLTVMSSIGLVGCFPIFPPDGECGSGEYKCEGTSIWRCKNYSWREYRDCADYGAECADDLEEGDYPYYTEASSTIPCVIPDYDCEDSTTECLVSDTDVGIVECMEKGGRSIGVINELWPDYLRFCVDPPGFDAALSVEAGGCDLPGVHCVDETSYVACENGYWFYIHDCDPGTTCVEVDAGEAVCE